MSQQITAARLLGVNDEKLFDFGACIIHNGRLCKMDASGAYTDVDCPLNKLAEVIENISTERRWTDEEKEAAERAVRFGFDRVCRDNLVAGVVLMMDEGNCVATEDVFPSLKEGETVKLEDIK